MAQAILEQVNRGWAFSEPSEPEVALARLMVERVPSVEKIRFAGMHYRTDIGDKALNAKPSVDADAPQMYPRMISCASCKWMFFTSVEPRRPSRMHLHGQCSVTQ